MEDASLIAGVVCNDAMLTWSVLDNYNDENTVVPFELSYVEQFLECLHRIWSSGYDPRKSTGGNEEDRSRTVEGVKNATEWVQHFQNSNVIEEKPFLWIAELIIDIADVESSFLHQYKDANNHFRNAMAILMSMPRNSDIEMKVISTKLGLAETYVALENYEESKTLVHPVLQVLVNMYNEGTYEGERSDLMYNLNNAILLLVGICIKKSAYAEAEEYMAQLANLNDDTFFQTPNKELVIALSLKGAIALGKGDHRTSRNFMRAALKVMEDMRKQGKHLDLQAFAAKYANLGTIYAQEGNLEAALNNYQKAMAIFRQKYGSEQCYEIALLLNSQGRLYININSMLAQQYCQEALEMFTALQLDCIEKANTLGNLAQIFNRRQDFSTATEYGMKAWKLLQQIFRQSTPSHELSLTILGILANIALQQGDFVAARQFVTQQFQITESLYSPDDMNNRTCKGHYNISHIYNTMGKIEFAAKNFKRAKEYYEMALAVNIYWRGESVAHPEQVDMYIEYGVLHLALRLPDEAEVFFGAALGMMKDLNYPEDHPDRQAAMHGLKMAQQRGQMSCCCGCLILFFCLPCISLMRCSRCCSDRAREEPPSQVLNSVLTPLLDSDLFTADDKKHEDHDDEE